MKKSSGKIFLLEEEISILGIRILILFK